MDVDVAAVRDAQLAVAVAAGEPLFMGTPDSWFDRPTWLCSNGHVSTYILKSEVRGDLCLACQQSVRMVAPTTREMAA